MKKSLLTLVLLLGVGLLFLNSCDGDSDSSITGTWQAGSMMVMFSSGGTGEADLPDSWVEQLTFHGDGSYTYTWMKDGRSGSGSGSWVRADGNLVLTDDGQTEQISYTLDSEFLSLKTTVPEGDAELVFTRVE
ncbi:hypothetical protein P3T73_07435 [Kiritimatiellota bacterium B12222]|nr:hypothetical protein P3T73_07435 [Kiritimatiellota bacterium B12222]